MEVRKNPTFRGHVRKGIDTVSAGVGEKYMVLRLPEIITNSFYCFCFTNVLDDG